MSVIGQFQQRAAACVKPWALKGQEITKRALSMIQIPVFLLLLFLLIWLGLKIFVYVCSLISPPHEFVIAPFTGGDDKQAKDSTVYFSSQLQELRERGKEAPTGTGLLTVPLLASTLREAKDPKEALGGLDKLDLKIKDVSVGDWLKAVNEMLAPEHFELRGTLKPMPQSLTVTIQLVRGEKLLSQWEASAPIAKDENFDSVSTEVVDQALYKMIFDFVTKPTLAEWGMHLTSEHTFKDWSTLRDYTKGLGALREYQETLDARKLDEAFTYFDDLVHSSPDEPYGLYFRGLVLSEQRKEREAVADYEALERLIDRLKDLKPTPSPFTQMLRNTWLNEASARLKFYNPDSAKKAIKILHHLNQELTDHDDWKPVAKALEEDKSQPPAETGTAAPATSTGGMECCGESPAGSAPSRHDRLVAAIQTFAIKQPENTKLLALSFNKLAHVHATNLSFMRDSERHEKGITKEGEEKERQFDKNVQSHMREMDWDMSLAEMLYDALTKTIPGGDGKTGLWSSERERLDVYFRMLNIRGYGDYRAAYFKAQIEAPKQFRERYHELCAGAIKSLELANTARPNHYGILQNIGIIYADEEFDPKGEHLREAQNLFERSVKLVPSDYYQYDQLAKIRLRQEPSFTTLAKRKSTLTDGKEWANKAVDLNPESREAHGLRVQINEKLWRLDPKDDAAAKEMLSAFKEATPLLKKREAFRALFSAALKDLADDRSESAAKLMEVMSASLEFAESLTEKAPRDEIAKWMTPWAARCIELTKKQDSEETTALNHAALKLQEKIADLLKPPQEAPH